MKVLLSPAKSLDFETQVSLKQTSTLQFPEKAAEINAVLRNKSPKQLSALMGISESLANLNYERNQTWTTSEDSGGSRPAVFAFNGEVYRGLDIATLSESKHELLQNTLRILSGQYGLLRPLDPIMPYRLEMGTKLPVGKSKNLYEFWRDSVTGKLLGELKENEVVVNLASNEYAKAVDFKALNNPVITPVFKELKNGAYKVLAVYAKNARGLMARYILDQQVQSVEGLKGFNSGGYRFADDLSIGQELIFIR
jgi:cytoplasmic iron level regulating protein YaaA (DUF328/UPF0246 family)